MSRREKRTTVVRERQPIDRDGVEYTRTLLFVEMTGGSEVFRSYSPLPSTTRPYIIMIW